MGARVREKNVCDAGAGFYHCHTIGYNPFTVGSREHMKGTKKVDGDCKQPRARALRVGYAGEKVWCIIGPDEELKRAYSEAYNKFNLIDFLGWNSYYERRSGPLYCHFPVQPIALSKLDEHEGFLPTRADGPYRYETTGKLSWFDFCKYWIEPTHTW